MRFIISGILKSCLRLLPLALLIAFFAGMIGPDSVQANPGWYNSSWQYRKKITINSANVTATLADFPVLISLTTDSDLASHARSDGYDILFTAADEVTKLSHEIESYNGTSGKLVTWVKIPSLSSSLITPTVIYMYYGNPGSINQQDAANVWDSNFRMVQHMEEKTGGANAIKDSTVNNNNGTDNNNPTLGATGKIDGSITFDGTNDNIGMPDSNSLDLTGSITIEAWVKTTDITLGFQTILEKRPGATEYNYYLRLDGGYLRFAFYNGGHINLTDTTTRLANNTWAYVVVTYNQSNIRLYVNGTQVASSIQTAALLANTASLYIAKENYDTLRFFNGTIDEVRISSTARSADWLKTSYNNQNNPSAFIILGPQVNAFVTPTVTTNAATLVEETTATLNGILNNDGGEPCQYSFEWGTAPGVYTDNISWTGPITTGNSFSTNLLTLIKGQKYYFRAKVINSAGVTLGLPLDFLTKPDPPTAFTATTISSSQIDLSWTKGAGAVRTMVRGKIGSYPTSYTDGYEVYFDTGTTASDTGLSPGTTIFYTAWSEVTGSQQWSNNAPQATATTNATPPPASVGGKVFLVNKAMILAPWLLLTIALSLLITRIVLYYRRKTPPRPKVEKNT